MADVGPGLSRLTDATLEATLEVAMESVRRQRDLDATPSRMAIVAMGRYGGFELSYGSDADVMFVHEPVEGVDPQVASSYAQAVANELRRLLSLPASDPPLEVDADLRPEGKQGPLVRTPRVVRRLLREVVEGLGGPGAAARRRGRRRPRPAARGSPS